MGDLTPMLRCVMRMGIWSCTMHELSLFFLEA